MSFWLMKSEPSEYSIDDLARDGSSSWFGVRNYQARNYMRDSMRIGDNILFYHSTCDRVGIVGLAEVVSLPHTDMTQFDLLSKYYDPRSTSDRPIWQCVDVGYRERFDILLSISDIRQDPLLSEMKILQKGSRLSITPVSEAEYIHVVEVLRIRQGGISQKL
jgi:predicted RNA-binding protein with PUA-like domain